MTGGIHSGPNRSRLLWGLTFGLLALYVAARMGGFSLWAEAVTPQGIVRLPATYATVDHPFHVARAEILWRELATGSMPRWIGQHQGGYPVEFYPLGEAWLEVAVRALSLGTLPAEGAHTIAIIALFLAPGAAFVALAREDGWSPVVGFTALVLHLSLPGSWYGGGYTELVQWGLVTNVAGAVAAFGALPALVRYLRTGAGWAGAAAAAFAALAVYCNPRSVLGLGAVGLAAWVAAHVRDRLSTPRQSSQKRAAPVSPRPRLSTGSPQRPTVALSWRVAQVAIVGGLLAAPQLIALAQYRDLYTFVQYSGYTDLGAYATATANAVSWPVLVLGLAGLIVGLRSTRALATTSVAVALVIYLVPTAAVVLLPVTGAIAPQLEPTRLMPLQRFLTLYLAAVALWQIVSWFVTRVLPRWQRIVPLLVAGAGAAILLIQTRPVDGPALDPASPLVPPVSLYAVARSAVPQQADLEASIRAADEAAVPGTALLVLGSALSWHQQLWAPLWTDRPLYYDNWLWYWHPDHAGTSGYVALAGHHYPDPVRTLERDYLAWHGIGAVVVTGTAGVSAAASPLLSPLRDGVFDAYVVADPVTTVTFGGQNASWLHFGDQRVAAETSPPGAPVSVRINWHPRWVSSVDGEPAAASRTSDGYTEISPAEPVPRVELNYAVRPLDWTARLLALFGLSGLVWLAFKQPKVSSRNERWYSQPSGARDRLARNQDWQGINSP